MNTSLLSFMSLDQETLSDMQKKIYFSLKDLGSSTHNELTYYMYVHGLVLPNHKENVRKRCYDLVKINYVVHDGERVCSITQKLSKTWKVKL